MAYHIKKPSVVNPMSITVYYCGVGRWSDDFSQRKIFSEDPSSSMINNDGKNGGWTGATVVSE